MKGFGWIILVILIALGIWYFGFYNDKYEAPANTAPTGEVQGSNINSDYEITQDDNNSDYYFTPTSRFTITAPNPSDKLTLTCDPDGAIGKVTNGTVESEGIYRFEAIKAGSCVIGFGDWQTNVTVLEDAKG